MTDVVKIEYNEVKGLIQRFADQGDVLQQTWDRVNSQLDVLKNGAWIGENADAFYTELDEILIGLSRLVQVMGNSSEALEQVASTFQTAEEEAGSLFA